MPDRSSVEFRTGQVVPFPAAPDGHAQVGGLLRSRVELLYLRRGRVCRRRVAAATLAAWIARAPLLPGMPDNILKRGVLKRSKRFDLKPQQEVGHAHDVRTV
jgi:hypothetical protein